MQLRELAGDKVKMSDTLNSLGMLKQRQHAYAEAEGHYMHSLEARPHPFPDPNCHLNPTFNPNSNSNRNPNPNLGPDPNPNVLEVRRALSEGGDKAKTKEKWQLVAQACRVVVE